MFSLEEVSGGARAGVLRTRAGEVATPFFMPVATFGTGKGVGPQDYRAAGARAVMCNAFLLSLRPGIEVVEGLGGVGRFMGFGGAVFTDSGGFQAGSDELFVKASRRGVHLRSPFDGSVTVMTPQRLVEVQERLGSDAAMVIDDMAPADASREEYLRSLRNTHRWARECKDAHGDKKQLLFCIVQGGYDASLRRESAEYLAGLDFDGYGIGGCAIGEPKPDMYRAVRSSTPFLPDDKPRYLMGVGSPPDVVQAVSLGVDCFDSVFPTRNARHNMVFTRKGPYQLEKARFARDSGPLEEGCDCWVCRSHSRAYLRHLSSVDEAEGKRLRQAHNLRFMARLMEDMRAAIKEDSFPSFKESFLEGWFGGRIPKLYKS
ncbi:tRNA guanosine(34) transglycosylase Tgt [Candidatus Woesearchaeota archaeon]|nr:tRNA guanosine(34) transglycosylase Tgt [Candidatus Woesearchaeota archaeon]